ncbi:MAG: hypothetical protein KBC48_01480 [Candidatus Pacebacteria bacterium]|nr:hypothetical protein [Candidatus Paceibacterota bacterium]
MQLHWRKNFWRNRAIAIFGFLIVLLTLFSGLPGWIETPLYFILGLLITIFGLAGSQRDPATDSTLARPTSNVNS